MQQIDLNSWVEFKPTIDDLRKKYGYHEYDVGDDKTLKSKNTVLFRGHKCADWPLQTSLERKTSEEISLFHYLIKTTRMVHELESYTNNKWNLPNSVTLNENISKDDMFGFTLPTSLYQYWIYLRHHGYPSPLLDWSESPYIAAYFAMYDIIENNLSDNLRMAVYAYIDSLDSGKSFDGGPIIQVRGPFVSTHKRHFIQKAWYTTASKWITEKKDFIFCSHHEIFDKPNKFHSQDILIKITLPVSERESALKDLDDYNINHFTLFQTEDSLVKALSIKGFDLNEF